MKCMWESMSEDMINAGNMTQWNVHDCYSGDGLIVGNNAIVYNSVSQVEAMVNLQPVMFVKVAHGRLRSPKFQYKHMKGSYYNKFKEKYQVKAALSPKHFS